MAQRRSLPLEGKINLSKLRIRQWYDYWDGDVYVSFSGGKDSTVLLDLVWSVYPDVPAVHSRTGLEYPEIDQFVESVQAKHPDRVVIVRPKLTFLQVIQQYGYPVLSKKVSRQLRILREHKDDPRWANTYRLYDTGQRNDGVISKASKLPAKWRYLVDVNFPISELCCDILKKGPLRTYGRESGRKPITGMMYEEGGMRSAHVKVCNSFEGHNPISNPMLFWTEQDVWDYIHSRGLEYSSIYDPQPDGTPGERRTGCMFCMFGVHLEKGENRFQRMARTHPKLYDYCINKLGLGKVLTVLGVPYESTKPLCESCGIAA